MLTTAHDPLILVVDHDTLSREAICEYLHKRGYRVLSASNVSTGLSALQNDHPDIVLTDAGLSDPSGMDAIASIRQASPEIPVIAMSEHDGVNTFIQVIQQGAHDLLLKPVSFPHLQRSLDQWQQSGDSEGLPLHQDSSASSLIGHSREMRDIYKVIESVSPTRVNVLLTGESGTGKEVVARTIHQLSPWRNEPFIAVNCSALNESLLESELFGHVRGSFTGAFHNKRGKFELAGKGTILLDEIGELPWSTQTKLLRVLQEKEFDRVGDEKPMQLNARVIAATNRDLEAQVNSGHFREDLYYRLNVVSIHMPPLRSRRNDIPALIQYLASRINGRLHSPVASISLDTVSKLSDYDWPGNVRELENILTREMVLSRNTVLSNIKMPQGSSSGNSISYNWKRTLKEVREDHIIKVLDAVHLNRSEAARVLGISKPTLYSAIRHHAHD